MMKRFLYVFVIILIIGLSAILRIGFSDVVFFSGDEDAISCDVLNFVEAHKMPPLFTMGKGIYTFSITNLVLHILVTFVKDPRAVVIIAIGIPNTLAVIFCFLFCYRFINKKTAVLSAALFGFSSWSILYSRNLWGVDVLQFFTILIFYLLAKGFVDRKPLAVIFSVFLVFIAANFHQTIFIVFISLFLVILLRFYFLHPSFSVKQSFTKHKLIYSAFLLIFILFSLFLVFWTKKNGLIDLENVFKMGFSLKAVYTLLNVTARSEWFFGYLGIRPDYPLIEIISDIFLRLCFILGSIYIFKRMTIDIKEKNVSSFVMLGFWFFIFISAFGLTGMTCFAHYFMVLFPVVFIIASVGFFSLIEYVSGKEKLQVWEILIFFIIFSLWQPLAGLGALLLLLNLSKIKGLFKKNIIYFLYGCAIFIVMYQGLSSFQILTRIQRDGGVPGREGVILGPKINAVKFIMEDAEKRYKETKEKSYCLRIDNSSYEYLFRYLTKGKEEFFSKEELVSGYRYKLISDTNESYHIEKTKDYICHKSIGPVLVIVERISET